MDDDGRPLRILHISALSLWAMKGNAGMCCLQETLRGHRRAGYQVEIIVPGYDLWGDEAEPVSAPPSSEFEVHIAPCRWLPVVKRVRAWARRLGPGQDLPYLVRWTSGMVTWTLLTFSLLWESLRLIYRRKRRFDMVYAHNEYAAVAGYLLRLITGLPNVTRLYGTFVAHLMGKPLVWLRYPVCSGGFLVPHSRLICANDGTRGDEVARSFGLDLAKFRFWQDGVDRSPRTAEITRDGLVEKSGGALRKDATWVLSCSRLSYWKRIDRIIGAVASCRKAGIDCQLIVAGSGDEGEGLRALAESLHVADDVVWLGAIPHAEVSGLMCLADVFMITNDVTNRCNPLFEAIRAGLPVVSVHDTSTRDLLEDGSNALLADPDDVEKLGRCLAEVCRNRDLAARMRQAQKQREELLWTWEERMDVEVRDLAELARATRRARGARRRPAGPSTAPTPAPAGECP